ncbi:MAG TPA: glycerophosphoryl diester phosphodiesterase membrane domain-containing protein [Streptomyces sp.]
MIPLRPLAVGEMLDGAVATLRLHWRAILGVTLAVALVTETVGVVVQGLFIDDTRIKNLQDNPDPSVSDLLHALSGTAAGSGLTALVFLIGWLIATAMLTVVTSRAVLGRTVTSGQAWRDARPRLPQLIGLALLLPLIGCGVLAAAVLPGTLIALAGAASGGAALASLGLLSGLAVMIWLLVQWSLAAPALMLEKQGVVAAMKRSAKLVHGSWWRVLGIQFLAALLTYLVSAIVATPITLIGEAVTGDDGFSSFLSGGSAPGWSFLILSGVGAVIGATITLPVSAGVTALLYMDQRIRRESLDLDLARAAKENSPEK